MDGTRTMERTKEYVLYVSTKTRITCERIKIFFNAQKCESKLHSSNDNHKEDINDLRSRYHQVNKQYIFGEIDIEGTVSELFQKDQDADHDMNEKTKSNFDLPPNDLFHFFDQDEEHVDIQEI
ncbi:hypothetical protein RFI_05006 [Reticulomyxa filosa]|uniref:Uncharacterized protein n=1 Tax=Reticulomyxa filosa TaxID=46433 RepID=X6P0M1_RETFI|nr:hypothetical protein RFI_05006 [Reticulomyxa filosa]|eukprot:ETO32110.1 hypothetical protein RFI_05006 [Reticulomyxa filosa]